MHVKRYDFNLSHFQALVSGKVEEQTGTMWEILMEDRDFKSEVECLFDEYGMRQSWAFATGLLNRMEQEASVTAEAQSIAQQLADFANNNLL